LGVRPEPDRASLLGHEYEHVCGDLAGILLEACNLSNLKDRKLLSTRGFRDRVARPILSAFFGFYGVKETESAAAQTMDSAKH
jgi:hypothetical protein